MRRVCRAATAPAQLPDRFSFNIVRLGSGFLQQHDPQAAAHGQARILEGFFCHRMHEKSSQQHWEPGREQGVLSGKNLGRFMGRL